MLRWSMAHFTFLVMGIDPNNKSSVSVWFSQGQGSGSVGVLSRFDSTETVVEVLFGFSISVA